MNRDICLWLENIFFTNGFGIIIDDDFLGLLRKINLDRKDTISNRTPFGKTNDKPVVRRNYGLVIENEYVNEFISLIKEKSSRLPTLIIN